MHHSSLTILTSALIFLGGCATVVQPTDLKQPVSPTCIQVPDGVEARELKGLLDYKWTTRLAGGPYIAEWEDSEGTYFRAPPGGIYIGRDDLADKPPIPLMPRHFDGGIWIPRQAAKPVNVYTYFSTEEAHVAPAPAGARCDTAVLLPASQAKGVSKVAFSTGGAIGGAAGGVVGRSMSSNSSLTYGQAAGIGAAGGAIGGFIVASLINMDVGKIYVQPQSKDPQFLTALERLRINIATLRFATEQPLEVK